MPVRFRPCVQPRRPRSIWTRSSRSYARSRGPPLGCIHARARRRSSRVPWVDRCCGQRTNPGRPVTINVWAIIRGGGILRVLAAPVVAEDGHGSGPDGDVRLLLSLGAFSMAPSREMVVRCQCTARVPRLDRSGPTRAPAVRRREGRPRWPVPRPHTADGWRGGPRIRQPALPSTCPCYPGFAVALARLADSVDDNM